jgi:hypothetical protein
MLAGFLRRIRLTDTITALRNLAGEIKAQYPEDEATPRLKGVVEAKAARLEGAIHSQRRVKAKGFRASGSLLSS